MHASPESSPPSWTCRLEWRPSRLLAIAQGVLGGLAAVSLMASALPPLARCLAAGLAFGWGLGAAGRAAGATPGRFCWPGGSHPASWEHRGRRRALAGVRVAFRGPIVHVHGRDADGRRHDLVFWPDTLDRAGRRRLRLAAGARPPSDKPLPSMAA